MNRIIIYSAVLIVIGLLLFGCTLTFQFDNEVAAQSGKGVISERQASEAKSKAEAELSVEEL